MTTEPINEIDMSATQQITVKTGDDEQAVQNRHAFRLLLGLGFIVFLVSMTVFIRIWAEYAYVYQADMVQPGAGIFGGLIIIATAFLAKRGNATLAMIIVTITFFAVDFFLITLLWNIGLPLTITITIGLILIASQVLPGKQVVPGVVAIFSIGTILLLIDIFWAAPRDTTAPQDLQIIYVGAFVIVATGLFVAIRQFSSFSLRTKLVSGAIALVVITVLFTTIFVNSFMRATLTEQLNEKFQLVGQSQASAVVEILTRQVEIMETLSLDSGLRTLAVGRNGGYSLNPEVNVARVLDIDERWTSDTELQEYLTSNTTAIILKSVQERFPSHAEMFMTDNIGAIVGATNVTSDYYQADEDWWQQAYNEGQGNIYIGEPAFDESRGVLAINIAVPMFDAAGEEFLGVLRTTYVVEELATLMKFPKRQ